jgi:hypothetical protein
MNIGSENLSCGTVILIDFVFQGQSFTRTLEGWDGDFGSISDMDILHMIYETDDVHFHIAFNVTNIHLPADIGFENNFVNPDVLSVVVEYANGDVYKLRSNLTYDYFGDAEPFTQQIVSIYLTVTKNYFVNG